MIIVLLYQQADNGQKPKVILLLSDFADNINSELVNKIDDFLKINNTEILLVNFAQGGNITDIKANELIDSLRIIDKIKVFSSKEKENIFNYIVKKTGVLIKENCCEIIFDIDPCYFQKDTIVSSKLLFNFNDTVYSFDHDITFKCQHGSIQGFVNHPIEWHNNGNELVLNFNSSTDEMVFISITDIMGNIINKNSSHIRNGQNVIVIPIINYLNGIYLIKILKNQNLEFIKFIKH